MKKRLREELEDVIYYHSKRIMFKADLLSKGVRLTKEDKQLCREIRFINNCKRAIKNTIKQS